MGIADSEGVIYDFAGPYHISVDHMAFGRPTRYLQLHPDTCTSEPWDSAVQHACDTYKQRMHNICCDNCHSHVGLALDEMGYSGRRSRWDMVTLCFWVFFAGKYVDAAGFVKQWLPFAIIVALIAGLSGGFAR